MLAEARAEAPSAARPLGCQAAHRLYQLWASPANPPTRSLIYSFTLLPPAPLSRLREMTGPQAGGRRTARAWHRPFRQDKRPPDSQAPHETSQNANRNGSLVFRKTFFTLISSSPRPFQRLCFYSASLLPPGAAASDSYPPPSPPSPWLLLSWAADQAGVSPTT